MSQDWFFDLPPSPINSPSPRRKGYASPIFAIVPDHSDDTRVRLRDHCSPIGTSRTASPVRRDVALRSPLASCSISRTSSASTPSLMRSSSPATPIPVAPGMGQRSRSAFARSANDLFPTEPRSRSQSAASPAPPPARSPSQRRELAREIVQQVKSSGVRRIPQLVPQPKTNNTQRAPNKCESVSRLPRREQTASVSSTTTTTRTGGRAGIVSKSVSTTSVTISKNFNPVTKTPPPVIDRSAVVKSPLANGRQRSCSPIRRTEGTLSRSKVQLLTDHREEEEDEVERRQRLLQERKSRASPTPAARKVRDKSPEAKTRRATTPAVVVTSAERVRGERGEGQPQHAAGLESRPRERIAARVDMEQSGTRREPSSRASVAEKERPVPQRKVLLFSYLVIVLLLLFPCPIRMIHLLLLDCHATAEDCVSMMHSAYSCPV